MSRVDFAKACLEPFPDIFSSQGLLQKNGVAEHSYEEGWNEARILQIQSNSRYRKYKELIQKSCLKTLKT